MVADEVGLATTSQEEVLLEATGGKRECAPGSTKLVKFLNRNYELVSKTVFTPGQHFSTHQLLKIFSRPTNYKFSTTKKNQILSLSRKINTTFISKTFISKEQFKK